MMLEPVALTCAEIMATEVELLPMNSSIRDAAKTMNEKNLGSVLVEEDDELAGIFTEHDLLRTFTSDVDLDTELLGKVATDRVITADINEGLVSAMEKMARYTIRHLPVIREGHLMGMISDRDLFHKLGAVVDLLRLVEVVHRGNRPGRLILADGKGDDVVASAVARPLVPIHEDEQLNASAGRLRHVSSECLVYLGSQRGIFTVRDLCRAVAEYASGKSRTRDWISSPLITSPKDATLDEVARQMVAGNLRHLVLEDDEDLTGVISDRQVVRLFPQFVHALTDR